MVAEQGIQKPQMMTNQFMLIAENSETIYVLPVMVHITLNTQLDISTTDMHQTMPDSALKHYLIRWQIFTFTSNQHKNWMFSVQLAC
jgi:succinate-acetate transporter protein